MTQRPRTLRAKERDEVTNTIMESTDSEFIVALKKALLRKEPYLARLISIELSMMKKEEE